MHNHDCDILRSSVCYVPIVAKNDAHTILHTCCNYTWRWSCLPNCCECLDTLSTSQSFHISSSYLKFALTLGLLSLIYKYLFSTKLFLLLAVAKGSSMPMAHLWHSGSTKSGASAGVFFNADVCVTLLCINWSHHLYEFEASIFYPQPHTWHVAHIQS